MSVKNTIGLVEKLFLIVSVFFTVAAMAKETRRLIKIRRVELKDLLLLIYAEVPGMLAAFYSSHRIPITIPLFIAMTALGHLIILQGNEGNPSILHDESGVIVLIAGACWVVSHVRFNERPER